MAFSASVIATLLLPFQCHTLSLGKGLRCNYLWLNFITFTQVSPDAARPSSRAWAVHASEAEAAFAALDDAMEHIRPSSSRAVAAGTY